MAQIAEPKAAWLPLGSLLVREGLITHAQLEEALVMQHGTGRRLGELLVEWGWVSTRAICEALAEQYEIEFFDLAGIELDPAVAARLPEDAAHDLQAVPIVRLIDRSLLVGVVDPTDVGGADTLRALLGPIRLAVVDQADFLRALDGVYS